MRMTQAIPAFPIGEMARSLEFYRDKLGFTIGHQEDGFAVLLYDAVKLNLWAARDESWRARSSSTPVVSGAESFIAGTASCRIEVEGVDELFARLEPLKIVHPNSTLRDQWWGERDFAVLDPDNNLITFFERVRNVK
ncbi:bleomycin resistance protein [Paenibacillus koleovorans]|uniref:bleomycin resistance protein n=1 Tax=Paenibacillus koleovorans TaxID=121608 RepID=UPI000FD7D563|nr:VOC family protein [Paenibacillus koleovorans]